MSELQPEPPAATLGPLALIEKAIEKGVDAEYMGKLMDLQERWYANIAAQAYSAAMNACQKEMPAILKDKQNSHTKSRYASWESLNALIRPIYSKHGFSLTFTEEPTKSTAEGLWMICHCRHEKGHVETVQGIFPRDGVGAKGGQIAMNALQAIGSTRSYAKRYLSKDLFALAESDEDNDGQSLDEPVKEDQIESLQALLEQAYTSVAALERFMAWLKQKTGADSIEKLTQKQYPEIVEEVTKLIDKKKGNGK